MIEAPDYTEGEKHWQHSTLYIENVRRSDDGLYECLAENIGGKFYKSGHIAVEFGPTFEDQVITKEWSWDQRSVNLSCLGKTFYDYPTQFKMFIFSHWYSKCHNHLVVQNL